MMYYLDLVIYIFAVAAATYWLLQPRRLKLHRNAIEFFDDLAANHNMYPDTAEGVVHQFIEEWELRDHTDPRYRTELP